MATHGLRIALGVILVGALAGCTSGPPATDEPTADVPTANEGNGIVRASGGRELTALPAPALLPTTPGSDVARVEAFLRPIESIPVPTAAGQPAER